jgi:hypothetical protein
LGVALPLAAFYTLSAPPPRRVPLFALSVVGFVLMLLTVGWAVPAANTEFTKRALAIQSRPAPVMQRPTNQNLLEAFSANPMNHRKISTTLSLSTALVGCLVLGSGVSTLARWKRRLAWAALPVTLAVTANAAGWSLYIVADVLDLGWRTRLLVRQLSIEIWLLSPLALGVGLWLVRDSRQLHAEHP